MLLLVLLFVGCTDRVNYFIIKRTAHTANLSRHPPTTPPLGGVGRWWSLWSCGVYIFGTQSPPTPGAPVLNRGVCKCNDEYATVTQSALGPTCWNVAQIKLVSINFEYWLPFLVPGPTRPHSLSQNDVEEVQYVSQRASTRQSTARNELAKE